MPWSHCPGSQLQCQAGGARTLDRMLIDEVLDFQSGARPAGIGAVLDCVDILRNN
jgi:hypothetical protein